MTISTGSIILASDINVLVPVGTIIMYAGSSAPTNYLDCDGSAVSRSTYSSLYGIIGTTYGVGDGSTTFNVPNYQGVVPKGTGSQTINARSKTGPNLGVVEEDRFQRFDIESTVSGRGLGEDSSAAASGAVDVARFVNTGGIDGAVGFSLVSDGTNGTPCTGATTRENSIGTNFYIKYQ